MTQKNRNQPIRKVHKTEMASLSLKGHCQWMTCAVTVSPLTDFESIYINNNFYYKRDPPTKINLKFKKYVSTSNDPSLFSRILRVHINKEGFVSAQYLPLEIGFDSPKSKCLQPRRLKNSHWIDVCSQEDKNCFKLHES
ncbi:hypothetical protein AC249_AIPGENE16690 [Exaiptasia diaphana]|nr:hypothetical protein AC249_AIPGENE16690 [Exaiptasia diaphana]